MSFEIQPGQTRVWLNFNMVFIILDATPGGLTNIKYIHTGDEDTYFTDDLAIHTQIYVDRDQELEAL